MSPRDDTALAALLEQARAAEPPALSPLETRRCARLAVAAAERRVAVRKRRLAWLCAACVVLGLTVFASHELTTRGTTIEVAAVGPALRVALTSGDMLLAAPGARLEVIAQEATHRELLLSAGAALFDVRRLGGRSRFEVFTRHERVRVLGTVFSVEIAGDRTIVRVYEGQVSVAERTLRAGEVWVSSGPAAALEDDPLAADGRAAAALRRSEPSLIVSSLPAVTASAGPLVVDAGAALTPADALVPPSTRVLVRTDEKSDPSAAVLLEAARGWLLAGDSERALHAAQTTAFAEQPAWQLLEADALRSLGRFAQAVAGYQRLAEQVPALRASSGYTGASLAFYELHDPSRALALLDELSLDAGDSPLRERASVLRVDVLLALGRHDQARLAAQRYLEREPETQVSRRMRALAR